MTGAVGIIGSVGGSVSIGDSGSVGFSGFPKTDATCALNVFAVSVLSSVGVMPRLDKSNGSKCVGERSGCTLVLWVLLIGGVWAGVPLLLNGNDLGPNPDTRWNRGDDTGGGVTVCDAGGLLPSSALL